MALASVSSQRCGVGMYDYCEPAALTCPLCRRAVGRSQGKFGPCALLVFREGHACPVDQARDEPFRLADVSAFRVPDGVHELGTSCCRSWDVRIRVEAGVWVSSRLVYVPASGKQAPAPAAVWSDALRVLAASSATIVACPECGEGDLEPNDELVDGAPFRYVRCPACKAFDGIAPDP